MATLKTEKRILLSCLLAARSTIEDDGGTLSLSFCKWFNACRIAIKKVVELNGGRLLTLKRGHYYFFGFLQAQSGQIYYFCCNDVRHSLSDDMLYYRTAESDKDFRGGSNQWVAPEKFELKLAELAAEVEARA